MLMLILKIAVSTLGLWLADAMLADVNFPTFTSMLYTGIALSLIGYAMEWLMLRRGTLWLTTVADWAASAAIIYLSQFVLAATAVSVTGALLAGGLLAIPEYFMHRYIIDRGAMATRPKIRGTLP